MLLGLSRLWISDIICSSSVFSLSTSAALSLSSFFSVPSLSSSAPAIEVGVGVGALSPDSYTSFVEVIGEMEDTVASVLLCVVLALFVPLAVAVGWGLGDAVFVAPPFLRLADLKSLLVIFVVILVLRSSSSRSFSTFVDAELSSLFTDTLVAVAAASTVVISVVDAPSLPVVLFNLVSTLVFVLSLSLFPELKGIASSLSVLALPDATEVTAADPTTRCGVAVLIFSQKPFASLSRMGNLAA